MKGTSSKGKANKVKKAVKDSENKFRESEQMIYDLKKMISETKQRVELSHLRIIDDKKRMP